MLFDDSYLTVEDSSEGIFSDKGSKFLGYAYPISSEAEIKIILEKIKLLHSKARHFCWAMRLSTDRTLFKFNDDGEPSGSAGRPILNTLLSADVTNILVVVVRYFGGTLLGIPGLINAYKSATNEALVNNKIISKTVNDVYELTYDYLRMNQVMKVMKEEDLHIITQQFDSNCTIKFEVRKSKLTQVLSKFEKIEGLEVCYLSTQ